MTKKPVLPTDSHAWHQEMAARVECALEMILLIRDDLRPLASRKRANRRVDALQEQAEKLLQELVAIWGEGKGDSPYEHVLDDAASVARHRVPVSLDHLAASADERLSHGEIAEIEAVVRSHLNPYGMDEVRPLAMDRVRPLAITAP